MHGNIQHVMNPEHVLVVGIHLCFIVIIFVIVYYYFALCALQCFQMQAHLVITRKFGVVMRSITSVYVSVCVFPVHTLAFESPDLEPSFLICRYVL